MVVVISTLSNASNAAETLYSHIQNAKYLYAKRRHNILLNMHRSSTMLKPPA